MLKLRKIEASHRSAGFDGELVMIHGDTGKFFALKGIGLQVWNALDEEAVLETICAGLEQEYDVTPQECRRAVQAFADQLVDAGFAEYF